MEETINVVLKENGRTDDTVSDMRQLIESYQKGMKDILYPQLVELKREGDSSISLASEKR